MNECLIMWLAFAMPMPKLLTGRICWPNVHTAYIVILNK